MSKEQYYKTLADCLPDLVWGFDKNYILQVANTAFFDMRKALYGRYLQVGDSLFADVPPEVQARWIPLYERVWAGERIITEDTRVILGETINVRLSLNPVYDEKEQIVGCMGITYDVTREFQMEQSLSSVTEQVKRMKEEYEHHVQPMLAKFFALSSQLNQPKAFNLQDQTAIIDMIKEELVLLGQKFKETLRFLDGHQGPLTR